MLLFSFMDFCSHGRPAGRYRGVAAGIGSRERGLRSAVACVEQAEPAGTAAPRRRGELTGRSPRRGWEAGEVVVPVPSPRHVKVGESVQCSLRPVWSCRDGVLLVLIRLSFGRRGPSVAAFHRGGDAEAALPAAGTPDDGTLLGEEFGTQIRTLCLLFPCPCPHGTC